MKSALMYLQILNITGVTGCILHLSNWRKKNSLMRSSGIIYMRVAGKNIYTAKNKRAHKCRREPSVKRCLLMFYYRNLNHGGTMTLKKHCAPLLSQTVT